MSYQMNILNQTGATVQTVTLDESVFADSYINNDLMYDFVRMQQANARVAIASTKNR
jgi:ribosomal protein L4